MILHKLTIHNVRNIKQASLSPSSTINFFYGKNASGKSSLLEAIFILGRAKSFRSSSYNKIINIDSEELIISGQSLDRNGNEISLGIRLDKKNVEIRINRETKQLRSALAYALPIQLIHPKSYKLIDDGSQVRREFVDWGIFNVHLDFLPYWRKFKKSLAQRNVLLKKQLTSQIDVWDHEMVQYGTIVADYRKQYLQKLKPVFLAVLNEFLDLGPIDIKIDHGWNSDTDYAQVLRKDLERDLRYGYTHSGPHRGDFLLMINKKPAKDFVSRGQLKLLVLALKLAQVTILNQQSSQTCCVLIDDLASELDSANKEKLLSFLMKMNVQIFMTATDLYNFGDISDIKDYRTFHVEHGEINQIA